ncbi:DNA-directed RNA polymerase III subunit RPC8-like [Watersipora subatra]|uniref:DNA-directed RNA polymerase III subunit RPC8-like n=1 Tax=Watersipora subatra TaxID=2589382 RepID=UPI00355B55CD
MFVIAELKDTITIFPWQFKQERLKCITQVLNQKFANKVVHKVGLCIALWDIQKVEDAFIFPGDGSSHSVVHFRYVVFRPFMDEILLGKIKGCSKEGVHVTLNFFDDILIPAESLQHPARFDEAEQLWVWEYVGEDEPHDLFMDIGEEIRFKVIDESFVDTSPTGPAPASADVEESEKLCPYSLTGSVSESGLGLLTWWAGT